MRPALVFALVALLIALLVTAGWLLGRNIRAPEFRVKQTTQVGDLQVTLHLDQAELGPRVVDVAIHDAAGKPVDITAVRLRFSMTEMNMGTIEADAQPTGRGQFQARGSFFTMAGAWVVEAFLVRDSRPTLEARFAVPIAPRGEISGPLNPLTPDDQTLAAGQLLYQANCATCHGASGQGDGPAAAGLVPRPSNFTQHMSSGKHTDGQIYLWIRDGVPRTAMPAWGQRLSETQIWQVVSYVRTFGQAAQAAPASPDPQAPAQPLPGQQRPVPSAPEPLPPLVFVTQGNLWRSDGTGADPVQLTRLPAGTLPWHPTVSADGKQIAFVILTMSSAAGSPRPTGALAVMNSDGTNLRTVWQPAQGLVGSPSWTPDGQALYAALNQVQTSPDTNVSVPVQQVVRVDLATGAAQPIVQNAQDPALSRDGTLLAYLQYHQDGSNPSLEVAAPDGSAARQVLSGELFQGFLRPLFAPDGKQIIFVAVGGPETDPQGYPIKPTGSSPLQFVLGLFEPPTAEAHGGTWDLWIVNTDGTGLRRLTWFYGDEPAAAFSPDGKQIISMIPGGTYMMDADGSRLRRTGPVGNHGEGLDWVGP